MDEAWKTKHRRRNGRRSETTRFGERRKQREGIFNDRNVVTIFIDNLPEDMTRDWLLQLFKFEGTVVDVYLSHRRRKRYRTPFGFVRYRWKAEAVRAMEKLNGVVVRGCKIEISLAKFNREGQANPIEKNKQPHGRNMMKIIERPRF